MTNEWTTKDTRQYQHVKDSQLDRGKSEDRAEEIAARVVNKHRREEGRTPQKSTQGTGNPTTAYEDRTLKELQNIAAERNVEGRSIMNKQELIEALRSR